MMSSSTPDRPLSASINDEDLKRLVESCKKKRLERTVSELTKARDGKVFVNRSISMDRIKYIGFDMDHTLVVYRSPEYDQLSYERALDRLVAIGYPKSIMDISYDETFAVRGLFFDKKYGNLLKLDSFGNILSCYHGFAILPQSEVRYYYPNKYIPVNQQRLFNLDTLFHIPEAFLLAALVKFFDTHSQYSRIVDGPDQYTGVKNGDIVISYQMIQQDVRSAIHWSHTEGNLKKMTLDNLPKYVKRDVRLPHCLQQLRQSGRKLFIATNSGYEYTSRIMSYLFDLPDCRDWKTYFDYIIVDACKPLFFQEGSMLRQVDETTGSLRLGQFAGKMTPGKVFSGGSSDAFCKIAGAQGKEVLYVGDHIFGDIIKSKKEQAFRTFLVIPELTSEIETFDKSKGLLSRIQNLEFLLREMYHNHEPSKLNEGHSGLPSIDELRKAIKETAQMIEDCHPNYHGSLLRCGSRLTNFANQVSRFADLYSSACVNLFHYPNHYLFSSPHQLMAHETAFSGEGPTDGTNSPLPEGGDHPPSVAAIKRANTSYIMSIDLDEEDGIDGLINGKHKPHPPTISENEN